MMQHKKLIRIATFKSLFLNIVYIALMSTVLQEDIQASPGISWYDWEKEPFELARKNNKLLMVNVGHESCVACRWMEEQTFSNPEVITLLREHFISIQVDSEARPDIGERYSDWAWPATAFMTPNGQQVLAIRGNRLPENFIPILHKLIEGHARGTLKADELAPYAAQPSPRRTAITDMRDQVRAQLDAEFDDKRGGWGNGPKVLEYGEPLLQYFLRYHLESDPRDKQRAVKTLNGFMQQTDPVWGGIFYVSFDSWDNVAHEKRLESQAAALQIFAEGYTQTRDPAYNHQLEKLDHYLRDWMRSDVGTFYAGQKNQILNLPAGMSSGDYYKLDDAGRRKYGLPVVDHAIYTDLNGRVISGYVQAYEATGDSGYIDTARTTANALLRERQTNSGWMLQFQPSEDMDNDPRIHSILPTKATPYLRTQGYFGLALLDLFRATAEDRWLKAAVDIEKGMHTLEDPELGGFYGSPPDGTEDFIARRKPLEDNAVAARFLYLLGTYVKDEKIKAAAIRTIRASAASEIVQREGRVVGNLALTLELLSAGYVEFSIVGNSTDPAAQALYQAGLDVYEPRKVLHYEKPGRYPTKKRSAMYICNDEACSTPIL